MRLASFIQQNMEGILQEWEDFARAIQPPHRTMNVTELRDHAEEMLHEIAEGLDRSPVDNKGALHPRVAIPMSSIDSAAQEHAIQRLGAGFSIDQLVAEYRALRASVLYLWSQQHGSVGALEVQDINRFNEALDRALSESIAHYSLMMRQAQDIFMGILGHDIRTPLNAIRMGTEALMRTPSLDSKSIQIASRLFNSTARMNELVDSLFDLTHARFGMKLTLRPADMGLLVEQVIEEIRATHPDRLILLSRSGELQGSWDTGRVCQILSNLICNALQHGSQTQPISVSVAQQDSAVRLEVHNFGPPIPDVEIGHIFEPMRRYAHPASASRSPLSNLGLGLYIAREVTVAHGGTLTVSSNEEDGTRFVACLPKGKHD